MQIVHAPNKLLNTKASVDGRLLTDEQWAEMLQVMQDLNGIGIAASQVGLPHRAFIMQSTPESELQYFINPELKPRKRAKQVAAIEGCLSIPGQRVRKQRADVVDLEWIERDTGYGRSRMFQGLEARIIQHEMDHLDGILIANIKEK